MKKLIFFMTLGLIACAGSAFASANFTATAGAGTGILNQFRTSNNVTLVLSSGAATYAAVSSHKLGDRVFGSSSGDSKIYKLDAGKTDGTDYTTAPSASDSSTFQSGWSVL